MINVKIKKREVIPKNESYFTDNIDVFISEKGVSVLEIGVSENQLLKREVQYLIKEYVSLVSDRIDVKMVVGEKTEWQNFHGIQLPLDINEIVKRHTKKPSLLELSSYSYTQLVCDGVKKLDEIENEFLDNIINSQKQGA